jgi:hypothetical protein
VGALGLSGQVVEGGATIIITIGARRGLPVTVFVLGMPKIFA